MRRHDIHTHTTYSDGLLSPKDLIKQAKYRNLEILGICDHGFSKKLIDTYQVTANLERYYNYLKEIKRTLKGLELKIGIEIDVSRIYGINPSQLPFEILNRFDYVLFEYVNTEKEYWGEVGNRDISEIIDIRNELEIPVGLAHNDIQQNYNRKELEIATILSQYEIFIEIQESELHPRRGVGRNTREGLDYYLHFTKKLVQELVNKGVTVVCGTDSHTGEFLGKLDNSFHFISENNLQFHKLVK
ncbi:MAG: PHP domain-containing protein [Candidatus Heimdallarchaeota archaeon]|nr:MAG: PHP domain-containing protein [Candidatus Heimdallarchaeota archaeon]